MKEVTISLLIEETLKEKFEKKCEKVHRTMASQIRYLIDEWLSKKDN